MIEMRPPRIARISAPSRGSRARSTILSGQRGSANSISPAVILALLGRMRRIAWLMTDFPDPDSPTSATIERGRMRNETPLTASIKPPGMSKRTCRSRMVNRLVMPTFRRRDRGKAERLKIGQGGAIERQTARRRSARRARDEQRKSFDPAVRAHLRPPGPQHELHPTPAAVAADRVIGKPHPVERRPGNCLDAEQPRGGKRRLGHLDPAAMAQQGADPERPEQR